MFPGLRTPFLVTVCVGLVTYLVVSNLGSAVSLLRLGFVAFRSSMLKKIVNHEYQYCSPRHKERFSVPIARGFEKFSGTDDLTPSYWWIFVRAIKLFCKSCQQAIVGLVQNFRKILPENEKDKQKSQPTGAQNTVGPSEASIL
jgi:hypothetical protein